VKASLSLPDLLDPSCCSRRIISSGLDADGGGVRTYHNGIGQSYLYDLALEDLFIDSACRDKAIDEAFSFLTITVNTPHSLKIVRRVPITVEQDQARGSYDVEAGTSSFCAEEKHKGVILTRFVELVYEVLAIFSLC
jgi:hypothetical protein